MPKTVLTDLAQELIATAAGEGGSVAISHVAVGTGNGASYDPLPAATALKSEVERVAISTRSKIGPTSWRIRAEFPSSLPSHSVREIGFFDAAGNLITLWAGLDVVPRATGAIDYIVAHTLNFSNVAAGLVTVEAPDDYYERHLYADLVNKILTQTEQMRQGMKIEGIQPAA